MKTGEMTDTQVWNKNTGYCKRFHNALTVLNEINDEDRLLLMFIGFYHLFYNRHTNPFIFLHHKHLATNEKYQKKYETRNNLVDRLQDNEIVPILRARLNDAIRDFTLMEVEKSFMTNWIRSLEVIKKESIYEKNNKNFQGMVITWRTRTTNKVSHLRM